MALALSSKPADAIYRYTWSPSLQEDDAIASFTLTETGCVIQASEISGTAIEFFVSGGTNGQTATIEASVETDNGESLRETLYLPIVTEDSIAAATAGDIITYALKPVVGLGATASSDEIADALEILNDMLTEWKGEGADVGAALPLTTSTVIYTNNSWLRAIKNNLRVDVAEQYGRIVSPVTARRAAAGLQQIKMANLPAERAGADYY